MTGGTVRAERVNATRELILSTAERLYAEHGVSAVSNRQVSEAAGQGNNAAVGYHFGTKADLVRAVVRRNAEQLERLRSGMVERIGDSTQLRDWVACMVRPTTERLAGLGSPTWSARFNAQAMTEPAFREIIVEESLGSASLLRTLDGLHRCLPDLPADVRIERGDMVTRLLVHTVAERERAIAEAGAGADPRASWQHTASGLIDAITGLWLAPVTSATKTPTGRRSP